MNRSTIEKFITLISALAVMFVIMMIVAGIFGLIELKRWLDRRDDKIVSLEYCFTEEGEHYLCN